MSGDALAGPRVHMIRVLRREKSEEAPPPPPLSCMPLAAAIAREEAGETEALGGIESSCNAGAAAPIGVAAADSS